MARRTWRRRRRTEDRMKGGQTKRRYRRKRYRRDIEVLREVTADLRSAYHERVPGRTNAYDELICFSTDAGRGDTGRLAIVAFGYDSVCHVVDLGYAAGKGDVDELRHQVDLQVLKSTIARRARRQRNTPPNELEIQLLIRFIVDLNHLLPQRDCGGGAFLAFADGWKTIDFRDPKNATQERIRRRLETIVWSDSAIPCAQPYRVEVHAGPECVLADINDLRAWLLGQTAHKPVDGWCFWSADHDLLTDRFVSLAWHILALEETDALLSRGLGDPPDNCDADRAGGIDVEFTSWSVDLRRPSEADRARAPNKRTKLLRLLLRQARLALSSTTLALEQARTGLAKDERRRTTLLAWARAKWLSARRDLVGRISDELDRRVASSQHFVTLQNNSLLDLERRVAFLRDELTSSRQCRALHQVRSPTASQP